MRPSRGRLLKVLRLDPSNVIDLLSVAKVLLMGNHLQKSVPYLTDYLKQRPNDVEGHEILGEVSERLGDFGSAQSELSRSVDLDPANHKARYHLGVVRQKLGHHGRAIAQLELAKRLNPGASEVYYELGRIEAARKNSSAASLNLKAYERLKHPKQVQRDVGKLNDLAVHSLGGQNWEAAAHTCRKAISLDPNKAETHYNSSLALSHLGDTAAEQEKLEKATKLDPRFAKAHNRLGLSYMSLGKLQDAEREFKAAIQDDPQFSEAKNNLNVLYGREGKTRDAVKEFQEATLDEPQYSQAFLNWGLVPDSTQEYVRAEKLIRTSVQLSPGSAQGYLALGMTEYQLGRMQDARIDAQTACRLLPKYGEALRLLALITRHAGSEATGR